MSLNHNPLTLALSLVLFGFSTIATAQSKAAVATPKNSVKILIPQIRGLGVSAETQAELTLHLRQTLGKAAPVVSSEKLNLVVPQNCLQKASCLTNLKNKYQITHLLQSQVFGLGSTFKVTLKLHDLRTTPPTESSVQESGKRAVNTFAEVAARAAQKISEASGLQQPEAMPEIAAFNAPSHSEQLQNRREVSRQNSSWYEKWWVWTIVGSVVAGATTAAVIGLGDDGGPGSTTTPTGSTNQTPRGATTTLTTTLGLK